jgi:nitrate/nitrite transporter NarK
LGLSAVIVFALVREKRTRRSRSHHLLRKTLTKKEIWYDFFARFGSGFAYLGAASWVTSYFVHSYHVPLIQAGALGTLMTAVGVIGYPLGGVLSDRIFGRRAVTILMGVAGIGILIYENWPVTASVDLESQRRNMETCAEDNWSEGIKT